MASVEMGRGGGGMDVLNVHDVENCPANCPLSVGNGQFKCERYNGDSEVRVFGGMTRETVSQFMAIAPCITGRNG